MAYFKNKRVMGIVMVLIGVLCIISSFYTWKTSDPMEWVLTEKGRAIQIMAMLIFCFGSIIFFIGIGILILDLWKGKSLKRNRNPIQYHITIPNHPAKNHHGKIKTILITFSFFFSLPPAKKFRRQIFKTINFPTNFSRKIFSKVLG